MTGVEVQTKPRRCDSPNRVGSPDDVADRTIMPLVPSRLFARAAARNNAEWCHAFSRTHGTAGRFRAAYWSSSTRTPPYYPDAITLRPEVTVAQLLQDVERGEGCSVKDSFACLNLCTIGFRPLFQAEWLFREPARERVARPRGWSVVTTEAQLREWEVAWGDVPGGSDFFRPELLRDETIVVLAGYSEDRIVAGAIANRSATVVGVSNVFHTTGDLDAAWAAGAASAAALWGDLPTVGYDFGDSLDAAHRAGFESIGELVVWVDEPLARR
jgi:hypothetical protein